MENFISSIRSIFLTAEWRKLVLINYHIDPSILKPYLPYKTELDFWKGNCYVSLVGFCFINTKLKGISVPFHRNFEEVNLRFYVRYYDGIDWKRGVVFIKEIVPKPALTIIANVIYKEKYVTLPMRSLWDAHLGNIRVKYEWKFKGKWDFVSLTAFPNKSDILRESEEEFITEHYWGYTQIGEFRTFQYQVEHPRWQMYPVKMSEIEVRFGDVYGAEFSILKEILPVSIMLAEGSNITVRSADKIL
jgi:uncharacterized protein YqjF (DUF2071 family)